MNREDPALNDFPMHRRTIHAPGRLAERPRSTGRLAVVTHANTALALAGSLTEVQPGRWASLPCTAPDQAMVLC